MNTNKFKMYIFELLLMLFLFFVLFASNRINRFFIMIVIIFSFFLARYTLKKSKKKSIYEKQVSFLMLICSGVHIVIFYLLGLYFGFTKNKYLLTFTNFYKIIIPIALIIYFSEKLRNILLNQDGTIKLKKYRFDFNIIFTFVIMVCIDMIIYTDIYDLSNLDDFLKAIGYVLFATLSCNLLYNYISVRYGSTPIIIFRIITCLYLYIIPYIPDVYIFMRTFLRMIYPFIIYIVLENTYSKATKTISTRNKRKDIIETTLLFTIVITLIMLISCQFKYRVLVIGSESMTGSINRGDVVFIERYDSQVIKKNQVIVFNYNNIQTVHRVYEVRKINNVYQFITKGDANKNIDNGYRKNSDISGIVKFKIKYIGLPTLWLRSLFEN